jgi:hypothetical protein
LGPLAASSLVSAVVAGDDRLERHFLELKSDLDLTRKTDLAKIAKYILGSANRLPDVAAAAFEGYGVMIIGVAPGEARGVPPIEVLEISKIVGQYLGAAGPRWDVVRVPVNGSANEVLVIVVDPPKNGQKPFPCRKDGDGLIDGRVYIRADGETREAKGDELDRLLERAATQLPPDVSFDVTIDGLAYPLDVDDAATLEAFIDKTSERLIDALPQPEPDPEPVRGHGQAAASSVLSGAAGIAAFSDSQGAAFSMLQDVARNHQSMMKSLVDIEPEKRTEAGYRSSIARWEQDLRDAWPAAVDELAGRMLGYIAIHVKNTSKTFFHDVELKIHLEGAVRGVAFNEDDREANFSDLGLPSAPRSWGPVERPKFPGLHLSPQYLSNVQLPSMYHSPLDWNNSGSVDLKLTVGELRPREEYVFDDEEIVLIVPLTQLEPVRGTWEITARDHNDIYSGDLSVAIGEPIDATSTLRKLLGLK